MVSLTRRQFPPMPDDTQVREPKQQDICYATQNRQQAIKIMSNQVDVVVVVKLQ